MDKLDAYLDKASARVFDWKQNNCAQFAGGWVFEKTGEPVTHEWEEVMHASTRQALRRLRSEGGYLAVACKVLGPFVSGAHAARGDVVLVKGPRRRGFFGMAWGVCTGNRVAVIGPRGLELISRSSTEAAWRV